MSKRKTVRFALRFTASVAIFGAAAVVLAGFSAFAMRSSRALPFDAAFSDDDPQISHRAIKTNRLSLLPATREPAGFMLASAPQGLDLERFYQTVTSAQPMLPAPAKDLARDQLREPARDQTATQDLPAAAPAPNKPQPVAALSAPEKPKRQGSPATAAAGNMLDEGAIAGLKTRLRLTGEQIEYWPSVESALREVARTQLRHTSRQVQTGKVNIDVNSPEVQKLIWAAMPLLMRLRAEQKSEIRKLARIMGLEQVASQI